MFLKLQTPGGPVTVNTSLITAYYAHTPGTHIHFDNGHKTYVLATPAQLDKVLKAIDATNLTDPSKPAQG